MNTDAALHDVAICAMKLRFAKSLLGPRATTLDMRRAEVAEETLLRSMVNAHEAGAPWTDVHAAKQRGDVMLYVKIGTHSPAYYQQVRRSPVRWAIVIRGLPSPGSIFAIREESTKVSVLRCVETKPMLGPLYYAERI